MGSAAVSVLMENPRKLSDYNHHVIQFWKEVRDNIFIFPKPGAVDKVFYKQCQVRKNQMHPDSIIGFISHSCSWGGKYFGGFAKNSHGTNYQQSAENSCRKKAIFLHGAEICQSDYKNLNPKNSLIYADPPYSKSTQGYMKSGFNSDEFWEVCKKWADDGNDVYVSEFNAPEDPRIVEVKRWERKQPTRKKNTEGKEFVSTVIEKLFHVLPSNTKKD